MEIKDVKANQGNVDVVAKIASKESPRTFTKFGKSGQVCNATLQDDTGKITLTLWNEDVEKVKIGDKIHVQNGWCSEFKGEKQLSAGKFGKIEVVESTAGTVFTNDPSMLQKKNPANAGDDDDDGDDDDTEEETEQIDEEEFVE